jgi:hypothetical protein
LKDFSWPSVLPIASLCFLATMKGQLSSNMQFLPCYCPKSNRARWPWTGTSETGSQNKSFLSVVSLRYLSLANQVPINTNQCSSRWNCRTWSFENSS